MQQNSTDKPIEQNEHLSRPYFNIGQHDSGRDVPLTDLQYGHLLNHGVSFATTPITNKSFCSRVFKLLSDHLANLAAAGDAPSASATPRVADPVVPPLGPEDTGLFPSEAVGTYTAWTSSWIELGSRNSAIAAISRQVLNLEIAHANFCGIRNIIISGPSGPNHGNGDEVDVTQYARAIEEALVIGSRVNIILCLPMCAGDLTSPKAGHTLSKVLEQQPTNKSDSKADDDQLWSWDVWHQIRSVCKYNLRLFSALRIPRQTPDRTTVDRWFSEPVNLLVLDKAVFKANKSGSPTLTQTHQSMIFQYMRLKNAPSMLLCDVGPDVSKVAGGGGEAAEHPPALTEEEYPSLQQSPPTSDNAQNTSHAQDIKPYIYYLRWLEQQQEGMSALEESTLMGFQDWLQSPLQPLSDNLESATYEVFEADPVKYIQYEKAMTEALLEWKARQIPTSSGSEAVVLAVAGAGRGPLVTRALQASKAAGVPIQAWAVEKNPNAYVYLLRQNREVWGGQVNVVKTDMRAWKGPAISGAAGGGPVYGKVDILVSELLGSFGDNELSPECLDGIQHVIASPHGISIPQSYTAHLSPISTPRIHADLTSRVPVEPHAFEIPWVVRLHQLEHVSRRVPGHGRFQLAWEFSHPIPEATARLVEERRAGGVVGGGGGSMAGAVGANDHNSRYCQLTFVCLTRGVVHGLAGYFESTLFESSDEGKPKVELSILPDQIDLKSKDMISWFPIIFPLKQPLYFPNDSELTVSMWRQTDDTKVWYEWLVEAYTWVGPKTKIKVGSSELCSSRKVACLL